MRKVIILDWKTVEGKKYSEKVEVGKGVFHGWGSDYEEFETGAGNYSTAIIEMQDGTIKNPHVEMIQFNDQKVVELSPIEDNESDDGFCKMDEHDFVYITIDVPADGVICKKCGYESPF